MIRGLIVTALLLASQPAFAHSWYGSDCCSGQDCFPLPEGAVQVKRDGYYVTWNGIIYSVPFGSPHLKNSQDQFYHMCKPPKSHIIRCLYTPAPGA